MPSATDAEWITRGSLSWSDETGQLHPLIAGSGLVDLAAGLWVIGDDLHHIVRLPGRGEGLVGTGHRIFAGELPDDFKERKRVKPDTECLIALPGATQRLLAFPSGSKKRRTLGSLIDLSSDGRFAGAREIDLSPLLRYLDDRIADLNIEGGTILGDQAILLQRGNGKAGINGTIMFPVDVFDTCLSGQFDVGQFAPRIEEVRLPAIDGVPLTFTDATAHRGVLYFSAAAERSDSTVEDGPVAGSVIGRFDGAATHVLATINDLKVEGLTVAGESEMELSFFCVTDADEAQTASLLLKARVARG